MIARSLLLVLSLLCSPVAASLFKTYKDDEGCSFSWRALGCTPSKECKLSFKLALGSFGPCVKRPAKAEKSAAAEPEVSPAESEPETPADETAAAESDVAEEVIDMDAEEEKVPAKDEP